MNYLAHLYLAGDDDRAKIGGLLGDFEKGNVKGRHHPETEREIVLHRKIDFYTDNHAVVRDAKKFWPEGKRKYAGVLLDVFYDHLLAKNWRDYSRVALADFTGRMYSILKGHQAILPERLRHMLPYMIRQDWLASYRHYDGFETAIARISSRLRKPELLLHGLAETKEHYESLAAGFESFFPELKAYVERERKFLIESEG